MRTKVRATSIDMSTLPSGFSSHPVHCGWAVLRDDLADALLAALGREQLGAHTSPEKMRTKVRATNALPEGAQMHGRAAHPVLSLGGALGRVVVRQCCHGGVFGKLRGRLFWGASRALNELRVCTEARERGAPVPEAAGVVAIRRGVGLCRLLVLTREIPQAVDLRQLIESGLALSPAQRREIVTAAAQAVAACHKVGLYHADLHVKNVLVQSAQGPEPKAYVIDLDKATLHDVLTSRQRLANLARLSRSIEKWPVVRRAVSIRDKLRFFHEYTHRSGDLADGALHACASVPLAHRLAWLGRRPVRGERD